MSGGSILWSLNPLFIGVVLRTPLTDSRGGTLDLSQSPLHRGGSSDRRSPDGRAGQSAVSIPSSSGWFFGRQSPGCASPGLGGLNPLFIGVVLRTWGLAPPPLEVLRLNPLFIGVVLRTHGRFAENPPRDSVSIPSSSGWFFGRPDVTGLTSMVHSLNPLFIGVVLRTPSMYNVVLGIETSQSPLHRGGSSDDPGRRRGDHERVLVSIPSSSGWFFGHRVFHLGGGKGHVSIPSSSGWFFGPYPSGPRFPTGGA